MTQVGTPLAHPWLAGLGLEAAVKITDPSRAAGRLEPLRHRDGGAGVVERSVEFVLAVQCLSEVNGVELHRSRELGTESAQGLCRARLGPSVLADHLPAIADLGGHP